MVEHRYDSAFLQLCSIEHPIAVQAWLLVMEHEQAYLRSLKAQENP